MAEANFTTVGQVMHRYADFILRALKRNLEEHDSIATWKLWQSIKVVVGIYGSRYTLTITAEDYWKWVELGRGPGKFPPPEAILRWTTAKGLDITAIGERFRQAREQKRLRKKTKIRKTTLKALSREVVRKQLAFLIGRKIATEGIEPTHFFSDVINQSLINKIRFDIQGAARKDIILNIKKWHT